VLQRRWLITYVGHHHERQMRLTPCVLPERIRQRPPMKIGVMGSASTSIAAEDLQRVDNLAQRLGKKIAAASCVLITGELDGIPGRVVEVHNQHGGLSAGISPAHSAAEHAALYAAPLYPSTVVIYSRDLLRLWVQRTQRHHSSEC
jgi:predicted Rossmann-fold nucleotide-binding protein